MARQENAREDLLAEATALVERAEFVIPIDADPVVVGFRKNGAASLYFGQDEAYHFDSAGRLRRAYLEGRLYKADGGRLASLSRNRLAGETQLTRHDLTDAETADFLGRLQRRLVALQAAVAAGTIRWLREVPDGDATKSKIVDWLAGVPQHVEIAWSARVR